MVRAHELMHARVSPHNLTWATLFADVSPRALECAEEFRVNTLVGRLGFDVTLLRDGSEKSGGRRLADSGEWGEAICFLLAVLGTGAERDYLAGIRLGNASWLAGLRAVRKSALDVLSKNSTLAIGSTALNDDGVPIGYAQSTVVLARLVTQSMAARVPVGAEALRQFRRSLTPGARRPPSGRFAPLVFDTATQLHHRPRSSGVRRTKPAVSGTVMQYPDRLLLDPQRRAFAQIVHRHGGIVLIDQSGSMDIETDCLTQLMKRAPNALVVGYSHRPGDQGTTPNAWVLAQRGGVARTSPAGNVGNGVDGPILRWASARRQGREPIIWVTDGQVTDSHDHPDEGLTSECAKLVLAQRITLVRELTEVVAQLGTRGSVRSTNWSMFGRVGRKVLEMKLSST